MLRRLATILALSSALALCAAPAQASDPLLSGYAGPGGGEQVVLGSTTVKTTKSGSGSGGSTASQQDPRDQSLAAAPAPASASSGESDGAGSSLTRKPQRKKSSSSTSKDAGDDAKTTTTTSAATATTPTRLPGAPEPVAYPTRAGEVSGLPISAAGILLLVLGVAAATLLGLGLRRFSGSDDLHGPQGPGV